MATAIREVELSSSINPLVDLEGYARCLLVFRWHRRVVGRQLVPVVTDQVTPAAIAQAANRCGADALYRWLAETIGYDEREFVGMRALTATVAICTRERPEDLARTLAAVATLTQSGHRILVVDNAPRTTRTREVVEQFRDVRYVCEPTPGLNVARNRAMREASTDVVAFTDDDAVPEREWLDALIANFGDPRVQCATEAQELFEEVSPFARGFRRRVFDGQHDNPVEVGRVGAGANMALRREIVDLVGPFDERLDAGTPTCSGGDHEMFVRILAAGYQIAYDPAAVSWHRHRRTFPEVRDTLYGYGVGVYAMFTKLLLERHELGVVRLAWAWFHSAHLPELRRRLLHRPPTPTSPLILAELRGCAYGPAAWFTSRRLRGQR
jgi:glycosyltransferase involved in cell wall biosynthesis